MQDTTEREKHESTTLALLEENRFLIHRSMAIQDAERRHLARELHDALGQTITAIRFDAELIESLSDKGDPEPDDLTKITRNARAISESAAQMYESIHNMIEQLHPHVLDTFGLVQALNELVRTWQMRYVDVTVHLETDEHIEPLESAMATHLYRIVQEALNNVVKYAHASRVDIKFSVDAEQNVLVLLIQDDGLGMVLGSQKRGLGLIGMRERVEAMEGGFNIDSAPGQGFKIRVTVPIGEQYQAKHRVWE